MRWPRPLPSGHAPSIRRIAVRERRAHTAHHRLHHDEPSRRGRDGHRISNRRAVFICCFGDVGGIRHRRADVARTGGERAGGREHWYYGDGVVDGVRAESGDPRPRACRNRQPNVFPIPARAHKARGACAHRAGAGVPRNGLHETGRRADTRVAGTECGAGVARRNLTCIGGGGSVCVDGVYRGYPELSGGDRDIHDFRHGGPDHRRDRNRSVVGREHRHHRDRMACVHWSAGRREAHGLPCSHRSCGPCSRRRSRLRQRDCSRASCCR